MYGKPLLPGQAFSFVQSLKVATFFGDGVHAANGRVLMPDSGKSAKAHEPRYTISPEERLIVQDYPYKNIMGGWSVPTWRGNRAMAFHQQLDLDARKMLFPPYLVDDEQSGAIEVTNVGWPEPTPESLMVQVKVLSYWPYPMEPWRERGRMSSIHWHVCQEFAEVPLEAGLPRALTMLEKYVENPAAALRERGFAV